MSSPRLGDLSPAGSVAIGIVVGLLSTSIQSIGLTLQRKSHQLEDEKTDVLKYRPPYKRRRWQIGMLMFVVANLVGSTIQITTLPLPVLSTLQASGLVFNTICASIILHEPFTWWSVVGTVLVAGGAVLIALFGSLSEPSHNLEEHLELLERRPFVLWMIGTFVIIAFILFGIFFINRLHRHKKSHTLRMIRGFAFGAISSILSAHALLVAKSAVELLVRTIADGANQFDRWQSWMILLLLVFFALSQLYFLHRGLKVVSTSVLYPFVFCIYNIVAILDGLIYFHQTSRVSTLHGILIALGTFVLLAGVLALSWRLDEEKYPAPPPEPHSLLTPGMGIVEDTTTEDEGGDTDYDIDADNSSVTSADEEGSLVFDAESNERTPLLLNGKGKYLRKSPSSKQDAILRITKRRRQRFAETSPVLQRKPPDADDIQDGSPTSHPRGPAISRDAQPPKRSATVAVGPRGRAKQTRFASDQSLSSSPEIQDLIRTHPISKGQSSSRIRARTMGPGPGPTRDVGNGGPTRTMWREFERERRRSGRWFGAFMPPPPPPGPRRTASTPIGSDLVPPSPRRRRASAGLTPIQEASSRGGTDDERHDDSLAGRLMGWWHGPRDRQTLPEPRDVVVTSPTSMIRDADDDGDEALEDDSMKPGQGPDGDSRRRSR